MDEAVDWILTNKQSWARGYRRECIKYWRERYGDEFADQVEAGVKARWGKR